MNGSTASSAGNFDLDHAYLRSTVTAPLTEAMAQLAILQPDDPVEFLGNYLLKFVANQLENQRIEELKKNPPQSARSTKPALYSGGSTRDNNSTGGGDGPQSNLEQASCLMTSRFHYRC